MAHGIIRGLTLWRPWPSVISRLGKRIENRTRCPEWATENATPGVLYRPAVAAPVLWLALHAGQELDREGLEILCEMTGRCPTVEDLRPDHISAVARYAGAFTGLTAVPPDQVLWFSGPVAWDLQDLVILPEPVACTPAQDAKCFQGLWVLPPAVLDQVREQWRRAREEIPR